MVLLTIAGLLVLFTTLYWVYYEFITEKVISNSHWHFRQFVYMNFMRELCIIILTFCLVLSIISIKWGNNKKNVIPFFIALLVEVLLITQLQIYQGP